MNGLGPVFRFDFLALEMASAMDILHVKPVIRVISAPVVGLQFFGCGGFFAPFASRRLDDLAGAGGEIVRNAGAILKRITRAVFGAFQRHVQTNLRALCVFLQIRIDRFPEPRGVSIGFPAIAGPVSFNGFAPSFLNIRALPQNTGLLSPARAAIHGVSVLCLSVFAKLVNGLRRSVELARLAGANLCGHGYDYNIDMVR